CWPRAPIRCWSRPSARAARTGPRTPEPGKLGGSVDGAFTSLALASPGYRVARMSLPGPIIVVADGAATAVRDALARASTPVVAARPAEVAAAIAKAAPTAVVLAHPDPDHKVAFAVGRAATKLGG